MSTKEKTDKRIKELPNIIIPNTNHYRNIHKRIRVRYGKATRCENPNCSGKSNVFDWSLKEGKRYSLNINDYQMLCRSCHMLQDSSKGDEHVNSKLTKENVAYIKSNPNNLSQVELGKMFGVKRATITAVLINKNWKHVRSPKIMPHVK